MAIDYSWLIMIGFVRIFLASEKAFTINRMYLQIGQTLETWIPNSLWSFCLLFSVQQNNANKMCITTRWDKSESRSQLSFQYIAIRGINIFFINALLKWRLGWLDWQNCDGIASTEFGYGKENRAFHFNESLGHHNLEWSMFILT